LPTISAKNIAIILTYLILFLGLGIAWSSYVKVQQELDWLYKQLPLLFDEIDNLMVERDLLQSQVANLEKQISSLQAQLQKKENEISTLQNQLEQKEEKILELNKTINDIYEALNYTKGKWNVLKVFTGSTYKSTELFLVPSSELRIKWEIKVGKYSMFSIWLYAVGGKYIKAWTGLESESKGEVYVHGLTPGNYYLEISAYDVQYKVTVEAWIPD